MALPLPLCLADPSRHCLSPPTSSLWPRSSLWDNAREFPVILPKVFRHEFQVLLDLFLGILLRKGDGSDDPLDLHGSPDAPGKIGVTLPLASLDHEDLEHEGMDESVTGPLDGFSLNPGGPGDDVMARVHAIGILVI